MASDSSGALLTPTTLQFIDIVPIPMVIYTLDGTMVAINAAAERYWLIDRAKFVGIYNVHVDHPATGAAFAAAADRARREGAFLRPEPTRDIRGAGTPDEGEIWFNAVVYPIRDAGGEVTHIGYFYLDVTEQVRRSQTLEQTLATQQQIIQELSSPIVQVWDGIVLLALVGAIDARRASRITEELLVAIGQYSAEVVILDITGVPTVDTQVANYLLMAARAVRLLGATVVLVGIRSEIAQTLVALGVDLAALHCQANLKAGIAWALAQQGLRIAAA